MNKDNRAKLGAKILADINEYKSGDEVRSTIKDVTEEYRNCGAYDGLEPSDVVFLIRGEVLDFSTLYEYETEPLELGVENGKFELVVVISTKDEEEDE